MAVELFAPSSLAQSFGQQLSVAVIERTTHQIRYDGRYISISYPGGDVPADMGVCTDVLIRSYRALGHDLQQAVHLDMKANFSAYPKGWGLVRPDTNIDHRRVPNLQTYFTRNGKSLLVGNTDPKAYLPGDLVSWMLPGNRPHIGVVTNQHSKPNGIPLLVHNAGLGPKLENVLFAWPITGHYRYQPRAALPATDTAG